MKQLYLLVLVDCLSVVNMVNPSDENCLSIVPFYPECLWRQRTVCAPDSNQKVAAVVLTELFKLLQVKLLRQRA